MVNCPQNHTSEFFECGCGFFPCTLAAISLPIFSNSQHLQHTGIVSGEQKLKAKEDITRNTWRRLKMGSFFADLSGEEKANRVMSEIHFSENLKKYRQSVTSLANLLDEIHRSFEGKMLEPENKSATIMLSYRFLLSSKCFYNLAVNGYYYESQVLLRSMLENMLYCWSFLESNDCAKQWYHKRLELRIVKKTLKLTPENQLSEGYKHLCEFVHPNMASIASFAKFKSPSEDSQEMMLWDKPIFEKSGEYLFYSFRLLNTNMLMILNDLFKNDLTKNTHDVINSFVDKEQQAIKHNLASQARDAKT